LKFSVVTISFNPARQLCYLAAQRRDFRTSTADGYTPNK